METKTLVPLTSRDKEIIFLVAKSLGFKAELNSSQQITKDKICMLLLYVQKNGWDKYNFHEIGVAALSFVRACRKIHRVIENYTPSNLRAIFPVRSEILI